MFASTRESAKTLAKQISTKFPPALQQMAGKKTQDMFSRAVVELQVGVQQLQATEKMGLIRRVVFARSLQNELLRVGYEGILVRQLMAQVISSLTFVGK